MMKKNNKLTALIALLLNFVFILPVFGCAAPAPEYTWSLNDLGYEVDIHTELQNSYLSGPYQNIPVDGDKEFSRPAPVTLEWSIKGGAPVGYLVSITHNDNFSNAITYYTKQTSYDVYNLRIGTAYKWRVMAIFKDGTTSTSGTSSFVTLDNTPRNIYVDGVTNVRDLGGWDTEDGGKVRQGLIYRCGRLNKSGTSTVQIEITKAGIDIMRDELGIRSEVDLRHPTNYGGETGGITSSPLGEDINYYNPALVWNDLFASTNYAAIRQFFEIAADESNYPFIFHCNIGTDRTGMFAYMINALCGVAQEDLFRDYMFSRFGNIEGNRRTIKDIENNYIKTINEAEGSTLSEKTRNTLIKKAGVPEEHIDAVIRIMKEEA